MTASQLTKNKNADGLRGIASVSVALHHFIAAFLPFLLHKNYPTNFAAAIHPSAFVTLCSSPGVTLFFNGNFPVMIFFVLSGYVLTIPYYNKHPDSLVLQKRLWGRYLRLNIPVAAAILLAYLVYICHGYFNVAASQLSGSTLWLASFLKPNTSAISVLKDMVWRGLVLGDSTLNPVFWTLKTEFIGSIYLLLFYICKPKGKNFLLLVLVMLLIERIDEHTPIFFFAILIGSLFNIISIPPKLRPFIILCGLYFGAFQYESSLYDFLPKVDPWRKQPFYATVGAILTTLPIINGYGARLLQSRPVQFLGSISFPLYLVHFTVLCSVSCGIYLLLPHTFLALTLNFGLYLFVAILLSILFEKYIDQPAIRISHRFATFLFRKTEQTS